jgi:transposase
MEELERIVERVRALGAAPEDAQVLEDLVASYAYVTDLIRDKQTTIARLRQMLFGSTSERSDKVLGRPEERAGGAAPAPAAPARAKGHGRNGAEVYTGARRVSVAHGRLRPGSGCPSCKGMLCAKGPSRLVRITATTPFGATVYERERLRCNLCGEVFTAPSPEGVGEEKYDETVPSMIATLRYGSGLPLNRIEQLQEAAGVPLPASTQWDLLEKAAPAAEPVLRELVRQAAQGEVLHNDDTPMVILAFLEEEKKRRERGEEPSERTGVFTTGIVAVIAGGRRIVLYATGHRHAGENLLEVLRHRSPELPAPTQMCDGLERNLPGELHTVVANCLAHGRRQFVDVVGSFPEEVGHFLRELALVYRVDERARAEGRSDEERLRLHQEESGPVMKRLELWLGGLIEERKVEPNSTLGKAILYVQNRWERMTLFLRKAGAPLDNNLCERMLKRAILHRKNSLFYKTENGARVGDLFMSLIATARMAEVDPFDYLTELQRHAAQVTERPADWMPWSYRETLARSAASPAGP